MDTVTITTTELATINVRAARLIFSVRAVYYAIAHETPTKIK